jgi:hypothetical protein
MTCAELDSQICDYVDGTLDAERKRLVETHLEHCASCAELARDSAAAVAFLERVADVEPPRELMTRLSFGAAPAVRPQGGLRRRFTRWLEPVLQPRVAMGMAMTILSFSMLGRFVDIPVRQLQPKDLNPAAIWSALDDKAHRTWERGTKYYESMRLFVELKYRLSELTQQEEEFRKAQPAQNGSTAAASPAAPPKNESEGRTKR